MLAYFYFTNTKSKGKIAEGVALKYLLKHGYKLLCRNWTCYAGEIDLVMYKGILVIVEVKSVSSTNFIKPYELFHRKKKHSLLRTINIYLASNNFIGRKWQLDLLCLTGTLNRFTATHYKNITDSLLQ